MFIDDDYWEILQDINESVEYLKSKITDAQQRSFFSASDHGDEPLVVTGVRRRDMLCYPGWQLYEFQIDLKRLASRSDLSGGFESAHVYALIGKVNPEARILNGQSPVIHNLNNLYTSGSNGQSTSSPLTLLSDDQYLEYLKFFCTFVAGEEGPFMIVEEGSDIPWAEGRSFEDVVGERRENFGWPAPLISVPDEKVAELLDSKDYAGDLRKLASELAGEQRSRVDEDAREAKRSDAAGRITRARFVPVEGDEEQRGVEANVLYSRHLFRATFAIAKSGMIEMLNDKPEAADLPVNRRLFHPSYPVLLLEGKSQEMTPEEFREILLSRSETFEPVRIQNAQVNGDVELTGCSIDRNLYLNGIDIDGDFIIDDLRSSRSISIVNSSVRGRFHAKHMVCDGELRLSKLRVFGYYDRNRVGKSPEQTEHVAFSLRGARINSTLNMVSSHISGGADLDEIDVSGASDLSGIRIDRREPLAHLKLEYGFSARGGRFGRTVTLQPALIRISPQSEDRAARPAHIVGNLCLSGATIDGALNIQRLQCSRDYVGYGPPGYAIWRNLLACGHDAPGFLRVDGSSDPILFLLLPGFVELDSMTVKAAIDAQGVSAQQFVLENSSISGNVVLQSLQYQGKPMIQTCLGLPGQPFNRPCLSTVNTELAGSLMVCGAELHGSFSAAGANITGFVDGNPYGTAKPTRIFGDVILSGAQVGSDIRFCAARIAGTLTIITGSFSRVQMRAELIDKPGENEAGEVEFMPTTVGAVTIQNAEFESIDFYALQVGNGENEAVSDSVEIKSVKVNDSFQFFRSRPEIYLFHGLNEKIDETHTERIPHPCEVSARIGKTLKIDNAEIGGSFDLTNLKVGDRIECRLLRAGSVTASGCMSEDDAQVYAKKAVQNRSVLQAVSIEMDRLECAGGADLSGVDVQKDVKMRGARAGGEVKFYDLKGGHAVIGGELDLTDIRTPHLILSGKSLPTTDQNNSKRLVLDRAEIGKLTLGQPIPVKADLQEMHLTQIEMKDSSGITLKGDDKQQAIRDFLEESDPFNRTVFRNVEKVLRDQGDDEPADKIYRSMRKLGSRGIFEKSIGRLTGYWTLGWRLLGIALLLTIPSFLIFSMPENIAPTSYRLSESAPETETLRRSSSPSPQEWDYVESLRVVARIHVPIIPFVEAPRWEPAENRPLRVANPAAWFGDAPAYYTVTSVSPALYAIVMQIVHWIIWPLVLIVISVKIQRRIK